jgi:hypothetical protein
VAEDRIGAVYSVGFDNPYPRRMWFFDRYSKYTQKAYGASVTELDVRGRETNRIIATEAWYDTGTARLGVQGRPRDGLRPGPGSHTSSFPSREALPQVPGGPAA